MPQVYCFKKEDYVDQDSCFAHYKQALVNGLKLADDWVSCQRENLGKDLFSMTPEQKAEMERMDTGRLTESEEKTVKASFEGEEELIAEEDYVIRDVPSGYLVSQGPSTFGPFADRDEAENKIAEDMKKSQFFPAVWHINDHGNVLNVSPDFYANHKVASINRKDISGKIYPKVSDLL